MQTTSISENTSLPEALVEELMADDLLPEYDIDYSKARPNRFAGRATTRTVELAPDVAAVFTTTDAVNTALRALIQTMPAALHPTERQ